MLKSCCICEKTLDGHFNTWIFAINGKHLLATKTGYLRLVHGSRNLLYPVMYRQYVCTYICINYNDLTATSLESWLVRGIIQIWSYFRLVNHYNLPRYIECELDAFQCFRYHRPSIWSVNSPGLGILRTLQLGQKDFWYPEIWWAEYTHQMKRWRKRQLKLSETKKTGKEKHGKTMGIYDGNWWIDGFLFISDKHFGSENGVHPGIVGDILLSKSKEKHGASPVSMRTWHWKIPHYSEIFRQSLIYIHP